MFSCLIYRVNQSVTSAVLINKYSCSVIIVCDPGFTSVQYNNCKVCNCYVDFNEKAAREQITTYYKKNKWKPGIYYFMRVCVSLKWYHIVSEIVVYNEIQHVYA